MKRRTILGAFYWWDDAVAAALRIASETGSRYRVERRAIRGGRWVITEPYPRVVTWPIPVTVTRAQLDGLA